MRGGWADRVCDPFEEHDSASDGAQRAVLHLPETSAWVYRQCQSAELPHRRFLAHRSV